ncbi:MAG: RNA polymerase sigma factor [Acidobacteriota bacterium]|nr:RNA polymerase sigma factor [Acidobacteriota bacterium]
MSAVSGDETQQVLVAPGVKPPLPLPRRLLRLRSDAALVERFVAGDEAAFDVIYERHRPVVLAVCMGVLGTPPDAEDATQETFSALAVALRSRPPAELRPWLIRVARNASIDTTRRRRHRLLTLDGEIPEVAARPTGPGKAELAVVLDGIRELPEGQRMALLMRELGGHTYAEIAEFLSTDEEAVKGLIARARVGLRTYREATELSCATARDTIAAEPDGRRYDKTIRRHLRGCTSCRAYRVALRDDAKALRAALPIQAGTVATGSLTTGMLTAAKGSLLGYGLTQAATTCAASACAVGAIGGMVFVAPVHKLGLWPILPAAKTVVVQTHAPAAVRPAARHRSVASTNATTRNPAGASQGGAAASYVPATGVDRPAAGGHERRATTHAATAGHAQAVHVTRVVLPSLTKAHAPGGGAAAQTASYSQSGAASANGHGNQGRGNPGHGQGAAQTQTAQTQTAQTQVAYTQGSVSQGSVSQGSVSQGSVSQGNGNSAHAGWSQGNGSSAQVGHASSSSSTSASGGSQPGPSYTVGSSSPSGTTAQVQPAAQSSTAQPSQGNGNGGHGRWAGGNAQASTGGSVQHGNPVHTLGAAATGAAASPAASAGASATSSSTTAPASGSGRGGQQAAGHGHGWGRTAGSAYTVSSNTGAWGSHGSHGR